MNKQTQNPNEVYIELNSTEQRPILLFTLNGEVVKRLIPYPQLKRPRKPTETALVYGFMMVNIDYSEIPPNWDEVSFKPKN